MTLSLILTWGCSHKPAATPTAETKVERAISSVASVDRILMITDSHGEGTFGKETTRIIEEAGGKLSVYAVGGSAPVDWLKGLQGKWGYWEHHTRGKDFRSSKPITPKLEDLIRSVNPDVVVIELGTNLIWNKFTHNEKSDIWKLMEKVTSAGKKCIWIGPPGLRVDKVYTARINEVYKFLTQEVEKSGCELHPSWETVTYPASGGDGIHYDSAGRAGKKMANKWVNEASTFIDQNI
jgi:hypothetical protein